MSSQTKSASDRYSDPKLRERLKKKIVAGDKGGRAGQWSARKAQLLAQAYKKAGGEYQARRSGPQKSLGRWTEEKWTTADGGRARRPGGTTRYLPKEAWDKLDEGDKKATASAKRRGSQAGRQYVGNTKAAKAARGAATAGASGRKKAAAGGSKKKAKRSTASAAGGKKKGREKTTSGAAGKKKARRTTSSSTGGKKKAKRTTASSAGGKKKTKRSTPSSTGREGKRKRRSKAASGGNKRTGRRTSAAAGGKKG